jgi:hypothetical protein
MLANTPDDQAHAEWPNGRFMALLSDGSLMALPPINLEMPEIKFVQIGEDPAPPPAPPPRARKDTSPRAEHRRAYMAALMRQRRAKAKAERMAED